MVPGLVNIEKKRWKITIFNGKIHYFDWAIFNSYVTNYQRIYIDLQIKDIKDGDFPIVFPCFFVCLPEGNGLKWFIIVYIDISP